MPTLSRVATGHVMGNNLNTKQISQLDWANMVAAHPPKYPRVGRVMSGPPGTVRMSGRAFGGIAQTVADNATSVSAQDLASFEAVFTTAQKVVKHTVPSHTVQTEAGLFEGARQLAGKLSRNIDLDFFSGLEGLFSATSPRAGTGVGQVGAGKYVIDTGKKGLQGEGGEFTYANKLSADFAESALDSGFQLMRGWKDDRGLPINMGMSGMALVVNPADIKLAHETTASLLSGSDNASNFYKGLVSDVVDYQFADGDAWFLIDIENCPVGYYLAIGPSVEITESDDTLFTHFVGKYNGCFVYSPYEYGLVGSAGA